MKPDYELYLKDNIGIAYVNDSVDERGNPTGGRAKGIGFSINWQDGPIAKPEDRNGAFIEDVLMVVILRLQFLNDSNFICRENSLAITHMQEALHWLQRRTALRTIRGVEGTHTP